MAGRFLAGGIMGLIALVLVILDVKLPARLAANPVPTSAPIVVPLVDPIPPGSEPSAFAMQFRNGLELLNIPATTRGRVVLVEPRPGDGFVIFRGRERAACFVVIDVGGSMTLSPWPCGRPFPGRER